MRLLFLKTMVWWKFFVVGLSMRDVLQEPRTIYVGHVGLTFRRRFGLKWRRATAGRVSLLQFGPLVVTYGR